MRGGDKINSGGVKAKITKMAPAAGSCKRLVANHIGSIHQNPKKFMLCVDDDFYTRLRHHI